MLFKAAYKIGGRRHVALLMATIALACNSAHATSWSLEQIASKALASHPSILGKQASFHAAEADVDAANWQRYPTVTGSVTKANDQLPRAEVLTVEQPLWTFGRISGGIDAAEARKEAAGFVIEEARQDILLRVVAAYTEALRQQDRKAVAEKGVEQHKRLLELISRRVEAEASADVDKQLALSRLYQANNDLSSINQALATALNQLSQLAGAPVDSVVSFSPEVSAMPQTVDQALEQAMQASPTVKRYVLALQAADADLKVKKSAYMPQLSVRYEKYDGQNPLITVTSTSTQSSRVMLVFQAQPGAGLSASSGVASAEATKSAVMQERANAVRDLQEQVTTDMNEFSSARQRVENAQFVSASSKAVYESYVRQYTTGRKTWLDALNTVRESTQSDYSVIDAKAQMSIAALRVLVRTGNWRVPQ